MNQQKSMSPTQLGYELLDPPHPHSPGGRRLLVTIRETPTETHFDPELVELDWLDNGDNIERTKLTLDSTFSGTGQVCVGSLVLRDRFDKTVHFFGYGGTLQAQAAAGLTRFELTSPAPILDMSSGSESVSEQLAVETEALLARIQAEWGLKDRDFRQHLVKIDPLKLYVAAIGSLLGTYDHSRVLQHSFHAFYQLLCSEKEWLSQSGLWQDPWLHLEDLLSPS